MSPGFTPRLGRLEGRVLLAVVAAPPAAGVAAVAVPLGSGLPVDGWLPSLGTAYYRITSASGGRLTVRLESGGMPVRVSLVDGLGHAVVQSDGAATGAGDDLSVGVPAGEDFIEVQGLGGAFAFQITAAVSPAAAPFQPLALDPGDSGLVAVADVNGDGVPDLIAADGVRPGLGDGTFAADPAGGPLTDPGWQASALSLAEFGQDSRPDVAVAEYDPDSGATALRLLRDDDGRFVPDAVFPIADSPTAIQVLDFGGGVIDLAVTDDTTGVVQLFQCDAAGHFTRGPVVGAGVAPTAMTAGRFGDGGLDLVVSDAGDDPVGGHGSGLTVIRFDAPDRFSTVASIPLGTSLSGVAAGDFGNGRLGLAVADNLRDVVWVLPGNGDGTFQPAVAYGVGSAPTAVVAGSSRAGGLTDLFVADENTNAVSVLLGNGDGTFQPQRAYGADGGPVSIAPSPLTGNGRLDLVVGNSLSASATVLLGNGDGTFQDTVVNTVGILPSAVAGADLNHDGHADLVTVDSGSDDVSVLLGAGDGTFQPARSYTAGVDPVGVAVGDFNGDGRLDLAVADAGGPAGGAGVSILLGNGDGTFQAPILVPMSGSPSAIVAGDFTGEGALDLAVADAALDVVTLLVGDGRGHFGALPPVPLGPGVGQPDALAAGDFGDAGLDLAVLGEGSDTVSILSNNGHGVFRASDAPVVVSTDPANSTPLAFALGNFTGAGGTDVAVAQSDTDGDNNVTFLQGLGGGRFQFYGAVPLGPQATPSSLAAAPFFGPGPLGLAVAGVFPNAVAWLKPDGRGGYQVVQGADLGPGGSPAALVAVDLTGSGRQDLAIARQAPDNVSVELDDGGGSFSAPDSVGLAPTDTPLLGDLNGDGVPDLTVVNGAGGILYRQGVADAPGSFDPPVTVNPGHPAHPVARVVSRRGVLLAAVDATDDALTLYQDRGGQFVRAGTLPTGSTPAQVVAADLTGDGSDDLIVRDATGDTLTLFRNDGRGGFLPGVTLASGTGVTDVAAVPLITGGLPDLVMSNRSAGTVEVMWNQGGGSFAPPTVYRAGVGIAAVTAGDDGSAVSLTSLEGTVGAVPARLDAGGLVDLVGVNSGSETLGVLTGLGNGRFANPSALPLSGPVLAVQPIDVDGTEGLAVLGPHGVTIWRGDGAGHLAPSGTFYAGADPTGLAVADVNGDHVPDLVVGNASGDVLILLGRGDGTFQPPVLTDKGVALAAVNPGAGGSSSLVVADQADDRVVVMKGPGSASTVLADRSTGLISPSAVAIADLNGDGIPDLIFADSGADEVFVYPGLPGGTFGPALNHGQGFPTGTNPVAITVADVNGDGRPDLIVADKGSNDVAVLLNKSLGPSFTFVPGPRLRVGSGPVSVAYADVTGDGVPDLVVSDSVSHDVMVLASRGGGFFDDADPTVIPLADSPGPLAVGPFGVGTGLDVVALNPGTNHVTVLSGLGTATPSVQTVASGGFDPVASLAVNGPGGFDGLVVANRGDGVVSLLEGGPDGLVLTASTQISGLPSPTALALASVGNDTLGVYAASAGEQAVTLLRFALGGRGLLPSSSAGEVAGEAVLQGLTLLPARENSLPLIATLLTPFVEQTGVEVESVGSQVAETVATMSGAVSLGQGQSLIAAARRDTTAGQDGTTADAGDEGTVVPQGAGTPTTAPGAVSALPSWSREVSGLDEALERFRQRARANRLFKEPAERTTAPPAATPGRSEVAPYIGPTSAVDAAVGMLARGGITEGESSPPRGTGSRAAVAVSNGRAGGPSRVLAAALTALVMIPGVHAVVAPPQWIGPRGPAHRARRNFRAGPCAGP